MISDPLGRMSWATLAVAPPRATSMSNSSRASAPGARYAAKVWRPKRGSTAAAGRPSSVSASARTPRRTVTGTDAMVAGPGLRRR